MLKSSKPVSQYDAKEMHAFLRDEERRTTGSKIFWLLVLLAIIVLLPWIV